MAATTAELRHSFQWSDLSRHSTEVGQAIDEFGEVTVIRGAQPLRLGPVAGADVVDVTSALCAVLARLVELDEPDIVRAVLSKAWPWTRALPDDDQLELAAEVAKAAEMAESVGTWHPLTTVLADWRRTPRAWADGAGPVAIAEPLGTAVPRVS